jgi:hypothetical protein
MSPAKMRAASTSADDNRDPAATIGFSNSRDLKFMLARDAFMDFICTFDAILQFLHGIEHFCFRVEDTVRERSKKRLLRNCGS